MPHLGTRAPTGDDVTQRRGMKPAFSNDLFERVLRRDNLTAAWLQSKRQIIDILPFSANS